MVGRQGFEPWKPMAADLQSAPFVHLGTCPFNNSIVWQSPPASIQLRERGKRGYKTKPNFSCRNRQKRASRVFPFKNRKGRPHQTEHLYRDTGHPSRDQIKRDYKNTSGQRRSRFGSCSSDIAQRHLTWSFVHSPFRVPSVPTGSQQLNRAVQKYPPKRIGIVVATTN